MAKKGKASLKDRAAGGIKEVSRRDASNVRGLPRPPTYTADDLLDKAEDLIEALEQETAIQFVDRALSMEPNNARALELRAMIALEDDDHETAYASLMRAIEIVPEEGYTKYLTLGQLTQGEEAVGALSKGLEIMGAALEAAVDAKNEEEAVGLSMEMSVAFCSLAELYLTDLCDVEEAQETCLALMEKALQCDPQNIEALQTLCSIHISMQEPEQALGFLQQSLALWYRPSPPEDQESADQDVAPEVEAEADAELAAAAASRKGKGKAVAMDAEGGGEEAEEEEWEDVDEGGEGGEGGEDEVEQPPFNFRINTCKLLIELAQYETAVDILEQLITEDDSFMDVWYLLGWTHHLTKNAADAVFALEKARELYAMFQLDQPDILQHTEELLASLRGDAPADADATAPAQGSMDLS